MGKRKAGGGGRRESGKMRKESGGLLSSGAGRTGPKLPAALRRQIDMIKSKPEQEKEERSLGKKKSKGEEDESFEDGDVYEYVAEKPQEELQKNRRFDPVEKIKIELPKDFEDEDVPSDDEDVPSDYEVGNHIGDGDDIEEENDYSNGIQFSGDDDSDGEEDDEERHARMLNTVTDLPSSIFKGEKRKHNVLVSEVHPESEYNPTRDILEGDSAITIEDLLDGFRGKPGYSKVRKITQKMEKKVVPVNTPLPRADRDKLERKVAYEQLKIEVTKMEPVVKRNREASTLYFDDNTNLGFSTVGAITSEFKPRTDFEIKIASLVHDDRLVEAHKRDGSRLLELNKVSLEEERERQNRLAKMRSLLFKHEVKAKHIKKIKSKTYHRLKKKDRLKSLGDMHMDPEAAKEQAMKQEFKRAEERMKLTHKNNSKWAKRILERGLAIQDEGTRAAITEQLHKHELLTRKMKSMNSSSSSDEGSDDDDDESSAGSDEEDASHNKLVEKAKQKTLRLLEKEDELPNSGVLSLPFMVRGLKKQQDAASEEARLALQEYESALNAEGAESSTKPVTNGRRVFGDVQKQIQQPKRRIKPEVEYNSSDSEYEVETKDTDSMQPDKLKDVNIDGAFSHEETENNMTSVFKNFKDIVQEPGPNTTFDVAILAPNHMKKGKVIKNVVADPTEQHLEMASKKHGNLQASELERNGKFDRLNAEESEESDTESEGQMVDGILSSGAKSTYELPSQAELIKLAFAGDDVVEEFEKEKQAILNEENPEPEEPSLVPGWGAWTHTQKKKGVPRWMVKDHEDAKRKREEAVKKRKDAHLKHVIISEKVDKKAEKLHTKTLPFPFTSQEVFEQSIRMPIGPEFNPISAVGELNRPEVMKRPGLIIQPIQYDDAIPYDKVEENGQKTRQVKSKKSGKTSSVKPRSKRK